MADDNVTQNQPDQEDPEQLKKVEFVESYLKQEDIKSRLDLTNRQTAEFLEKVVDQMERDYETIVAREFVRRMTARISNETGIPSDLLEKYRELLLRAKFACLEILGEEEIINILSGSVVKYLRLNIADMDVIESLRRSCARFIFPPDTEPYLEKILHSLEQNDEVLGNKDIMDLGGQVSGKPVVKNWVKDYFIYQTVQLNGQHGSFERISYLNQSPNVRNLSKEERDLLLKILELVDWLRYGWSEEYGKSPELLVPEKKIREIAAELFNNPSLIQLGAVAELKNLAQSLAREGPPPAPKVEPKAVSSPSRTMPPPPRPVVSSKLVSSPPPTPSPSIPKLGGEGGGMAPSQPSSNEALYRSTLEELKKIRVTEQTVTPKVSPTPARPIASLPPSPLLRQPVSPGQGGMGQNAIHSEHSDAPHSDRLREPFSVNEALIHAGANEAMDGEVISSEGNGAKDLDQKPKDLRDKNQSQIPSPNGQ